MAPNIPSKGRVSSASEDTNPGQLIAKLAEMQAELLAGANYVGRDFADRARAMHIGDETPACIYGEATVDQARDLTDEGVKIAPLPLPVIPPGSRH